VFRFGLLAYFLVCAALRAAGDARTPLYLGVVMTAVNATLDIILIRGWGWIPAYGTRGAAFGMVIASGSAALIGMGLLFSQRLTIRFSHAMPWRPDWSILRPLFGLGFPAALQGLVMNVAGIVVLRLVGSLAHGAEAQASYAICYAQLFALITLTSNGLHGV
jgi:Na+-driven multidrug efflux pump